MFGFIKNWFIKREMSKFIKNKNTDELNLFIDEYLKRNLKEHSQIMQTAEKINRASILDLQTKKLKSNIKNMLDDDDDDEEEEEEEEDNGDDLIKNLVNQFVKNKISNPTQSDISGIVNNLTPEQKEIAKQFLNLSK